MLIRAKDMLARITGVSTPWLGISWTPPGSDRDAIRKFLAFVEDRRALFNPMPAEVEDHVISSIRSGPSARRPWEPSATKRSAPFMSGRSVRPVPVPG